MGDESCTYQELNHRANRLAQYIRSIAAPHEPSIQVIVSLYAVLKSGCCYVPFARDYPQNRVDAPAHGRC
jgi:non-ribosomal peptide synthetase component F